MKKNIHKELSQAAVSKVSNKSTHNNRGIMSVQYQDATSPMALGMSWKKSQVSEVSKPKNSMDFAFQTVESFP